jgi:hypothetical protein
MLLNDLNWAREEQPILSGMTDRVGWRNVQVYNPTVIRVNGLYKMWFLGNNTATRTNDMNLGYAESEDGLNWEEHSDNPILKQEDLPWGGAWQTPHVMYDSDVNLFKMWFIMSDSKRDEHNAVIFNEQWLGYATSPDGIAWNVKSESLGLMGRRPCVLKENQGLYRMWMNSAPDPDGDFRSAATHIFGFTSEDGIAWSRDEMPAVSATDKLKSVVYPFVVRDGGDHTMWYGCHVDGGVFEIYSSTSINGETWTHHHSRPSFEATRDPNHFDGRYTSTPCVLVEKDRYLMYYSARDWGNLYGSSEGQVRVDGDGIYRHIGVATCERKAQ